MYHGGFSSMTYDKSRGRFFLSGRVDQFKGSFYPWFFPSALPNFVRLESPRFHEKNLSKRSLSFTHNKCSQLQPDISPLLFFVLAATTRVVLPGRTYLCLICGHASLPHCLYMLRYTHRLIQFSMIKSIT